MKKKSMFGILLAVLLFTTTSNAQQISCMGQRETVWVDGQKFEVNAYQIQGYNYFKLRDVGYLLQTSNAPFSVTWNAQDKRIEITTGTVQESEKPELTQNIKT